MGDASHYSDTILQAIEIISQNKVNKANYDRTVRAQIKDCVNKATGQYLISYEGIEQTAYATNPDLKYTKGQGVYVLIPSNNSQRVKTIINTIDHLVTTSDGERETSDLYNQIGPNALVLPSSGVQEIDYTIKQDGSIQLSSYVSANAEIYNVNKQDNIFTLNPNYEKYLKNGDGIVLKANLQTALPIEQQSDGVYGIKVTCRFKKNGNENQEVLKTYTLSNLDVYGYPYTVIEKTNISHLEEFDGQNFIRIEKIEVYNKNFPVSGSFNPDIFFSNFSIQGAGLINITDENNYLLFINYSANGDTIDKDGNNEKLLLKSELKLKGVPITDNVEYYWFRQNGTVFRNNSKYSSYGGEGWECLNNTDGKNYIGALNNNFYFFGGDVSEEEKNKLTQNGKIPSALLDKKVLNIKCVALYNRNKKVEGKGKVFNENIDNQLVIFSSDDPSVDYYFGNGSPSLECLSQKDNGEVERVGNNFTWLIEYKDGTSELKKTAAWDISAYFQAKQEYQNYENEYSKVADNNKTKYKQDHQQIIDNWNNQKGSQVIQDNHYYNVNIDAIKEQAKITCGVSNNGTYIGTASITLYNHMQVKGEYSLNILNGTQVFQYDDDGISPCSKIKESPLNLKPLQIMLLDNEGRQIDFKEIINNGSVTWCIPKTDTLLVNRVDINGEPLDYIGLTGTDRALAASDTYSIYKNLQFFAYSIDQTFDYNKRNNNIRLYIVYKDMTFDIYTDFTFPKSGDPGTNGTKYYGKILPGVIENGDFISRATDRVYIDRYKNGYDDQGRPVTSFKGVLYNGSIETSNPVAFWSCPLASSNASSLERENTNSHFRFNKQGGTCTLSNVISGNDEDQIDILRSQFGSGDSPKYFAELPICYIDTTQEGNNSSYRVKLKPKTGYSYVTYTEDGTHPDYGKNNIFEIVLQHLERGYYIEQEPSQYTWNWRVQGNLTTPIVLESANIAIVNPKESFDGQDLTSKIIVSILNRENLVVATIYIPIYMLINRYGHKAINDWDGNSIELGENKDGAILAPQVGAGKKDSSNNFTGVLMGQVKYQNNNSETGLFGYDKGQRTIFLDAQTGKAEFGKNTSGKIIIDPSQKMNGKDVALLYSNNFKVNSYIQNNGKLQDDNGNYISYQTTSGNGGMVIDLTSPQIVFASGKFSVDKNGKMHAAAGNIAGWEVSNNELHKKNETGMASASKTVPSGMGRMSSTDTISFWSGGLPKQDNATLLTSAKFYATHEGYLHSEAGDIGGWKIGQKSLLSSNSSVGMSSDNSSGNNKAFFANGNNFYVTHNGFLRSQSGQIANWNISSTSLSDGNVGMGQRTFSASNPFTNSTIPARIWAGSSTADSSLNFVVTDEGRLYSRYGSIGGWNISSKSLSAGSKGTTAGGIMLDADGSISGGDDSYTWAINKDGSASFKKGQIGNWYIQSGAIQNSTGANPTVSLNSNGTITANTGSIGGITISGNGLSTNNWYITSDGKASFTNVQALSGSMGGGTISGGTLSGSGLSGCIASPNNLYTGNGDQTYGQYMYDLVSASTGNFGKLIINDGLSYNGKTVNMQTIYIGLYYTPTTFYAYQSASATTKKLYTINHLVGMSANAGTPPAGTELYAGIGWVLRGSSGW